MSDRLQLYRSNRVENLADALADLLREPLTKDPLGREVVVIHSSGLERWIKMRVAQRLGICANVDFLYPQQLMAELYAAAFGDEVDARAWSSERLVWGILALLPELLSTGAFREIRAYLKAGRDLDRGRRTFELADQIAVHFERYIAYRPLMVQRWAAGEETTWEAALWRKLAEHPAFPDVSLAIRFMEQMRDEGVSLPGIPPRVSVFSVVSLPPLYVHLLGALARHVEVHLFVLSPSPAWWEAWHRRDDLRVDDALMPPAHQFEIATADTDNPLLASMGNLARDLQVALEGVEEAYEEPPPRLSSPPPDKHLLGALQADIYHSRQPEKRTLSTDDRSVRIHACHGELRQVQTLRDELLRLFEEVPGLEPRDVLVMAPDIEVFAPLVEAVFADGAGDDSSADIHEGRFYQIPYALADRGVASENPAAAALLAVLDLADSRLEASAVMDLLSMPPVRGGFKITPEDLPTIRQWVAGAGIRWGADDVHRDAEEQPVDEAYTWRLGLDRLLAGQALAEQELPALSVLPHGDVESREERALLGSFVDFAEKLLAARSLVNKAADLVTWRERLFEILDTLVRCTTRTRWQAQHVRDGINEMLEAAQEAGFSGELDLLGVQAMLGGRFLTGEAGDGFVSGRVTFCQLVPMRSIPFRVICLLGMDDGAFPRTAGRLGFDLMAQNPRLGDRSAREDDRALFLEALLSARDHLIICYTGRGVRDDRSRPPAVPVAELLDAIDRTAGGMDGGLTSEQVVVHHPLQPFSPRLFGGVGGEPVGHDARQLEAADIWLAARRGEVNVPGFFDGGQPLPPPQETDKEVDVHRLAAFFQHPIKALLERRLGIWLPEQEDRLEDREPQELGFLETYTVRDRLLSWRLSPDPRHREAADERIGLAACLPLGQPGKRLRDSYLEDVEALARRVEEACPEPSLPPMDLDLNVDGTTLVGRMGGLYDGGRVAWRAGRTGDKYALDLWVKHVALCATGWQGPSRLLGIGDSMASFRAVPKDEAELLLADLVQLYWLGQQYPLLFFPTCSWTFRKSLYINRNKEDPVRASHEFLMRQRYHWDSFTEPGDHGRIVLGELCPYDPDADLSGIPIPPDLDAAGLAEAIWGPTREYRTDGRR